MTTHHSQSSIVALFSSSTLAELLRLFCLEPDRQYYQRELARLTGAHLRQLQRDLARLTEAGLVSCRTSGNRVYYRAVREHPVFDDLRQVILKTVGLNDILRRALVPYAPSVSVAFVFGSFARGQDTAESDVDLLVIGTVSRRSLAAPLAEAARELGREVNLVLLTPADLRARLGRGDHFIDAVLADPRLWVVGDEQALAALA